MKIISIQVGMPKNILYNHKTVTTGIFKTPINGPVMLRQLNIDGDGQADLTVHGGRDKALYAYGNDVYKDWKRLRPKDDFPFGAMGENLTMDSLPENSIYIGDTFELGAAIVQVAQPRFPCYKLAVKFDDVSILKQFVKLSRPGVYFRVIKEGLINVGDELKLISQEKVLCSVNELFNFRTTLKDPHRVEEILTIKSLPPNWRDSLKSV